MGGTGLCPDPEEEAAEAAEALEEVAEAALEEAAEVASEADSTVALADVRRDLRADLATIGIITVRISGAAGSSDPITTAAECSAACSLSSSCR